MRKIILTLNLSLLVFLTIINGLFLFETAKDKDLREFYFQNQELSSQYLEIEKTHMEDVKNLSFMSLVVNLISLVIFIIFYQFTKIDYKMVSFILLGIAASLILAAIFFEPFFNKWHTIFFNNDNWLLPSQSKLINDYPLSYFKSRFIFLDIVLAFSGLFMLSLNKINNRK